MGERAATSVTFLTNGENTPSSRFRVQQFVEHVAEEFDYRVRPGRFMTGTSYSRYVNAFHTGNRAREILVDGLTGRRFFIQRMLIYRNDVALEKLLFSVAKDGVIVDFDDAIFLANPNFAYTVRRADLVVAGNAFLAEWASSFAQNVKVIPTCVDHERYLVERQPNRPVDRKIRVGWTGTKDNIVYLQPLAGILCKLQRKYKFDFVLVSDSDFLPAFLTGMDVQMVRWSRVREVEQLADIDIGLMPLPRDDWARGKCGFKLLQYMATGAVAIGSAVGANKEIIEHGRNGLLCESVDDWAAGLEWIVSEFDTEGIRHMAVEARNTIVNQYSVAANWDSFTKAITELR